MNALKLLFILNVFIFSQVENVPVFIWHLNTSLPAPLLPQPPQPPSPSTSPSVPATGTVKLPGISALKSYSTNEFQQFIESQIMRSNNEILLLVFVVNSLSIEDFPLYRNCFETFQRENFTNLFFQNVEENPVAILQDYLVSKKLYKQQKNKSFLLGQQPKLTFETLLKTTAMNDRKNLMITETSLPSSSTLPAVVVPENGTTSTESTPTTATTNLNKTSEDNTKDNIYSNDIIFLDFPSTIKLKIVQTAQHNDMIKDFEQQKQQELEHQRKQIAHIFWEMYSNFTQSYNGGKTIVGMFTGNHTSSSNFRKNSAARTQHLRIKRQMSIWPYKKILTAKYFNFLDKVLIYFRKFEIRYRNQWFKIIKRLTGTLRIIDNHHSNEQTIIIIDLLSNTTNIASMNVSIEILKNNLRNYWTINSISWNNKLLVNKYRSLQIPNEYSYYCGYSVEYVEKDGTAHIPAAIRLTGLQLQLHSNNIDNNISEQPLSSSVLEKFGEPIHCIGFITPGLSMGLFIGFLLLFIIVVGINCILNIKSMNKFDKICIGKPIK